VSESVFYLDILKRLILGENDEKVVEKRNFNQIGTISGKSDYSILNKTHTYPSESQHL
ncbi:hypothetical protein THOM_1926, partial [Trachipleistophora hominis]